MLCSVKSKGAKKSPPRACSALDSGQFFPAKMSKKSLGLYAVLNLGAWRSCGGTARVSSCGGCAVA